MHEFLIVVSELFGVVQPILSSEPSVIPQIITKQDPVILNIVSSTWPHIFYLSRRLSVVGLWPSSSLSTGCVVPLRGDWAIFCHACSGRVGRKTILKILHRGWELNPVHREDRQWAIPLSYHDWLSQLYHTTPPLFALCNGFTTPLASEIGFKRPIRT